MTERLGIGGYQVVQNAYSLLGPQDDRAVRSICAERSLAFTPFSPLAGGALTGKYQRDVTPPPDSRMALRPGQLIGDAGAYSGLASPVDVVACSRGTLAKWDLRHLTEFTASRPALRAKLSNIVSADLAAKLRDVTAAVSGLAGETVAPGLP